MSIADSPNPPPKTATPQPLPPSVGVAPWWANYLLASAVIVVFAVLAGASCFLVDTTLRTQMFTAAAVGFGTSIGFFFGSSAGSAKKDDTIAASNAALATSAPVITTKP